MIGQIAAALALVGGQATAPPPRPCVTPNEAGAGAAVLMPELVEAVTRSCSRHLSGSTFLSANGAQLAQRWRSESVGERQTAGAALTRVMPPQALTAMTQGMAAQQSSAGGTAASPQAGPDALLAMVPTMVEAAAANKFNPQVCKGISRLIEGLAPLSAQNLAQLVSATMMLRVALSPPKGDDGPPICRS